MPIAHSQVEEVILVLCKYLDQEQVRPMLLDLSRTEAFRRNASFRETICRLLGIVQ